MHGVFIKMRIKVKRVYFQKKSIVLKMINGKKYLQGRAQLDTPKNENRRRDFGPTAFNRSFYLKNKILYTIF